MEKTGVGKPHINAFIAHFNGVRFEIIAFAAGIAAVLQTELIAV